MAHHKRRRPKNARAGCLMCKGWKANGVKRSNKANWRGTRRPAPTLREEILDLAHAGAVAFTAWEASL